MTKFLLFETAAGISLFTVNGLDLSTESVLPEDKSVIRSTFALHSNYSFGSATEALEELNKLNEGSISSRLKEFLKASITDEDYLFVSDASLLSELKKLGVKAAHSKLSIEASKAMRRYCSTNSDISRETLAQMQVGLSHLFSNSKLKNQKLSQDMPCIQASATIEVSTKTLMKFYSSIREWFSWSFPELEHIIKNNSLDYVKVVKILATNDGISEDALLAKLTEENVELANEIVEAHAVTLGVPLAAEDTTLVLNFANKYLDLFEYKLTLSNYLDDKLMSLAPNLKTILGSSLAAKMIAKSGSLQNLAMQPSSTVQLLGAEKALFRALKAKTNTPKYGLLYGASYVGKVPSAFKGKLARSVANSCALAARFDCYDPTEEREVCTYGLKQVAKLNQIVQDIKDQKIVKDPKNKLNKVAGKGIYKKSFGGKPSGGRPSGGKPPYRSNAKPSGGKRFSR